MSPIASGGKFLSVACSSTHTCGIFLPNGNTKNGATGAGGKIELLHVTYKTNPLQGYLAHKKQPPLGPYSRSKTRALWWS